MRKIKVAATRGALRSRASKADAAIDEEYSRFTDAELTAEIKKLADELGIDVDLTYRLRGAPE